MLLCLYQKPGRNIFLLYTVGQQQKKKCFHRQQIFPLNVKLMNTSFSKMCQIVRSLNVKWILWKTKAIVKDWCPYIYEGIYYNKNQEKTLSSLIYLATGEPSASPYVHEQQRRKENVPLPSKSIQQNYIENSLIQN